MGMAKKEIFGTQFKQIFCQLDVMKQLFLCFEHFETNFVFLLGGGGGSCFHSFLAFFFFLLSSFFTASFVAHFIVFPLCGVLLILLFFFLS